MKRTPVNTWLDENKSVGAPPSWSDPDVRRKLKIGGSAAAAVLGVALVIAGATAVLGGGSGEPEAAPAASGTTPVPSSTETASAPSVLECQEIRTPERSESSGAGDTNSPDGLIIAYENAFFAARDARAMAAMSIPGPAVASEEQLAKSITSLPTGTPWCVSIAPAPERDNFDVSVRFVEADGETVTTWAQTMTVIKDAEGLWKIVGVRSH
ncbi:hypothetical protein GS896_27795 [Rhodococcus hoagii]|nr:hypothetical protein [Prescottella equi]MBM4654057.1 hypothetical protein [Prescottella equi]MBM4719680.1 hypothetical protein [Prescottella equi]NKR23477.1 hypothetical protein [Prescottella equi]NKT55911.1 hypothetical protein [Prescottella equi]